MSDASVPGEPLSQPAPGDEEENRRVWMGRSRGLWGDAWRRLCGSRVVLVAVGLITLIAVVALVGP
ncbi:MAG TPA: hypothetical protein VI653_24500, partial [Steroidobacteraceae bacterium]